MSLLHVCFSCCFDLLFALHPLLSEEHFFSDYCRGLNLSLSLGMSLSICSPSGSTVAYEGVLLHCRTPLLLSFSCLSAQHDQGVILLCCCFCVFKLSDLKKKSIKRPLVFLCIFLPTLYFSHLNHQFLSTFLSSLLSKPFQTHILLFLFPYSRLAIYFEMKLISHVKFVSTHYAQWHDSESNNLSVYIY